MAFDGSDRRLPRVAFAMGIVVAFVLSGETALSGNDYGAAIDMGSEFVFVSGHSYRGATDKYDVTPVKYNGKNGAQISAVNYDGNDLDDTAVSNLLSSNESLLFVLANTHANSTNEDILVLAYYTNNLTQKWKRQYDRAGGPDEAFSMDLSPDGTYVYVVGRSCAETTCPNVNSKTDFVLLKIRTWTGAQTWAATYDSPAHKRDVALDVAVDGNGTRIYVAGHTYMGTSALRDTRLVAFDDSGNHIWNATHDGPKHQNDWFNNVVVNSTGSRITVSGKVCGNGDHACEGVVGCLITPAYTRLYDFYTATFNRNGLQVWNDTFNGPGNSNDHVEKMVLSPDGKLAYVTGYSCTDPTDNFYDYHTIAYRVKDGSKKWSQTKHFDVDENTGEYPHGLALGPDGRKLTVTGDIRTELELLKNRDYGTITYNATTGSELWWKRYNGAGNWNDWSRAATSNNTYVVITGESCGGVGQCPSSTASYDFATLSYKLSDGTQLWLARYDGPAGGNDVIVEEIIVL